MRPRDHIEVVHSQVEQSRDWQCPFQAVNGSSSSSSSVFTRTEALYHFLIAVYKIEAIFEDFIGSLYCPLNMFGKVTHICTLVVRNGPKKQMDHLANRQDVNLRHNGSS